MFTKFNITFAPKYMSPKISQKIRVITHDTHLILHEFRVHESPMRFENIYMTST